MAKKTKKYSGRLVAQIREIIGQSQARFATMIGVSKHTIISVENGRNKLTEKLARRIQLATGADITDESFRFASCEIPATENPHKLTPEAIKFLQRRYDGTGKYDNLYTREDFDQWRANFYPSNDEVARRHFDQLKIWVEYIFRAAARSSVAGNRDRLPAVRQSLVEWLEETLENFKLEREVDELFEEETHSVGEYGFNPLSIIKSKDRKELERLKEQIASFGYDFVEVRKECRKAKPGDWIFLETECRRVWDPFNGHESVPCANWKIMKKPRIWFEFGYDAMARVMKIRIEDLLGNQPELIAAVETLRLAATKSAWRLE